MKVLFILSIILFSTYSDAVVKRHDVSPENYVLDKIPEYLIDMPHEGYRPAVIYVNGKYEGLNLICISVPKSEFIIL